MTDTKHNKEFEYVAGNGLLDRRLFLKRGIQFGTITALASTVTQLLQAETETAFNSARPPG